ncbi:hypothetical protein G6F56_012650 [Rhizopus delemar]|nr:hypothetical protein G6F56_012650 [Rhizopus delemar]
MANATVFSTLDLKSAFNQFPVYEPDQVKTTFTAPNNLQYMYRGAPFGISTHCGAKPSPRLFFFAIASSE